MAAAALFLIFGMKMLSEGYRMESGIDEVNEEIRQVEIELKEGRVAAAQQIDEERADGSEMPLSPIEPSSNGLAQQYIARGATGIQNLLSLLLSPVFAQTFILTFLGEWGDRSQIATMALAAGQDFWWVTLGTITGHGMCTGVAVMGGRLLASKISVRNVTLGGGLTFLIFGLFYGYQAIFGS